MPKQNNIWTRTFNESNLANEDWLEPSESVFINVQKELAKKKNKRRFLWLSFIGLLLVVGIISLNEVNADIPKSEINLGNTAFQEISTKSENISQSSAKKVNEVIEENTNQDLLSQVDKPAASQKVIQGNSRTTSNNAERKAKALKSVASEEQDSESSLPPTPLKAQEEKINSSENGIKNTSSPIVNDLSGELSEGQSGLALTSKKITTASLREEAFNEKISTSTSLSSSKTEKGLHSHQVIASKEEEKSTFSSRDLSDITPITLSIYPLISHIKNEHKRLIKPQKSKDFKKNSFSLGAASSTWLFRLNDEYKSSLEPANYAQSNGQGFSLNMIYDRQVSKRFQVGIGLGFEQINSSSGHNSIVEYKLEDEHNGQVNEVNLVMASPLGSVDSKVVIARQGSIGGVNQNVKLDLLSDHKINSFSILPNVTYKVVDKARIDFTIKGGVGIHYLSGISNLLASISTENENFSLTSREVLENQQFINQFLPTANVGTALVYHASISDFISLEVNGSQSLTPVFSQDKNSTSLARIHVGLVYGKRF